MNIYLLFFSNLRTGFYAAASSVEHAEILVRRHVAGLDQLSNWHIGAKLPKSAVLIR